MGVARQGRHQAPRHWPWRLSDRHTLSSPRQGPPRPRQNRKRHLPCRGTEARITLAQRRGLLFKDAVDQALAAKLDAFRNEKHRMQWRSTLNNYAILEIGMLPVQEIDTAAVLRVRQPIWATKTETATRVRGRIESVLSWATVAGHRTGDNPARWAGNLKELLPAASKVAKERNHPALQLDDAPRLLADLRNREGIPARALEFAALTAARSE